MSVSEDLINFDLIETHKENIQQLPGGRSARQLVNILSPMPTSKSTTPTLDDTKTLNDAIRHEYELEVQNIAESDDPLDVFDRYVKWTLNAYPSAQATPQSQLLPLLERATKAFLTSSHYKNDPRYLKLWLHYIRWFSDAPREAFAYLARHNIGERLALFYEEFASWLESAGRWTQAEEVYKLGLEREARPTERLMRKSSQFQQRLDARQQDVNEPTSPALPTVRPALVAKIDPFAPTPRSNDPQTARTAQGRGSGTSSRASKPKMAIFSDADNATPPATAPPVDGWQSIGSLQERKKENTVTAKPWAGETLKAGKRVGAAEKMTVFKDQNLQIQDAKKSGTVPTLPQPVVNSKTGKAERVFVNLEAVYPNPADPSQELSFDELRAIHRGWADKNWRKESMRTLQAISGNAQRSPPSLTNAAIGKLSKDLEKKVPLDGNESSQQSTPGRNSPSPIQEVKPMKQKKMKVREIKQETQTVKTNLASPTGPKIRRKLTAEPTMTFHSKAATDDVYNLFNQPLKCEAPKDDTQSGGESDFDDDGYSTAGESTGTGMVSGVVSESGNEDTSVSVRTTMSTDENTGHETAEMGGEWTEFSTGKHMPHMPPQKPDDSHTHQESNNNQSLANLSFTMPMEQAHHEEELKTPVEPEVLDAETKTNTRFVPIPPEDYDPTPLRAFRDPANVAQSRLPFMTPIVEKTESSLAANTAYQKNERDYFTSKTPSRSNAINKESPSKIGVERLLLSSPFAEDESPHRSGGKVRSAREQEFPASPSPKSKRPSRGVLEEELDDFSSPRKKIQITKAHDSPIGTKVNVTTTPTSTPTTVNVENGFVKPAFPNPKPTPPQNQSPIITDLQCNPTDPFIRSQILASIESPLSSYSGFFNHPNQTFGKYTQLQRYAKKVQDTKIRSSPRKSTSNSNDRTQTQTVAPVLAFTSASRVYAVRRELGQGAFAPVYLVDSYDPDRPVDSSTTTASTDPESERRGDLEAVKAESPPSQAIWEFHIIRTIRDRLTKFPSSSSSAFSRSLASIISAHECHAFADEAYLILDYAPAGTLLDLVNVVKADNKRAGKPESGLEEVLAMFFTVELLRAVEALHRVGILHGDLKGDNCLVRLPPPPPTSNHNSNSSTSSLFAHLGPYSAAGEHGWADLGIKLIDFGRGIDVTAFPPRVGFIADWAAGPTEAPEIREARPWVWQIDLWGAAGVLHSCLFGRYLETMPLPLQTQTQRVGAEASASASTSASMTGITGKSRRRGCRYKLKEGLKRYWQVGVWSEVFDALLNPVLPLETSLEVVEEEVLCTELGRVRDGMERFLEAEGEKKGLRGAVRRVEGLVVGGRGRR